VTERDFRIATTVHGRYLVNEPDDCNAPLLVGFHGYAETAEKHLATLREVAGTHAWRLCAIQALHPFYKGRSGDVVASWMTRLDRELAIEDNVRYVAAVVSRLAPEASPAKRLVYCGFSQGAAMAYRAAACGEHSCDAVIVLGGDVPPELAEEDLGRIPRVLIGRGSGDEWYAETALASDVKRLENAGVATRTCRFNGGHEWTAAFRADVGSLLASLA
jgi:predicted esterase